MNLTITKDLLENNLTTIFYSLTAITIFSAIILKNIYSHQPLTIKQKLDMSLEEIINYNNENLN